MLLSETLKNSDYICENVHQSALVENLDSVLMQLFGMKHATRKTKALPQGIVCWLLNDGSHDVYIICEYHIDTDTLQVKLNYGDFNDTFKNMSKHVAFDSDGNTQIDRELNDWSTDVLDEWADTFSY